jgi:hypothetical protein
LALGSGEALGQNLDDNTVGKVEGTPVAPTPADKAPSIPSECSKATDHPSSSTAGKRKRGTFTKDEIIMLTNMSDAVNNVANALRETGPTHVDAALYLAVMEMPRFSEEGLIVAYTFLLDNKDQGRGFVNVSDAHRTIWLRTFLDKNNFI